MEKIEAVHETLSEIRYLLDDVIYRVDSGAETYYLQLVSKLQSLVSDFLADDCRVNYFHEHLYKLGLVKSSEHDLEKSYCIIKGFIETHFEQVGLKPMIPVAA
jgi:hypothetical protein